MLTVCVWGFGCQHHGVETGYMPKKSGGESERPGDGTIPNNRLMPWSHLAMQCDTQRRLLPAHQGRISRVRMGCAGRDRAPACSLHRRRHLVPGGHGCRQASGGSGALEDSRQAKTENTVQSMLSPSVLRPPANPALPAKRYQACNPVCLWVFGGDLSEAGERGMGLGCEGQTRLSSYCLDESSPLCFAHAYPPPRLSKPQVCRSRSRRLEVADRRVPVGTWLLDWACAHRCSVPTPALDQRQSRKAF